jgi:cytidine deaminase
MSDGNQSDLKPKEVELLVAKSREALSFAYCPYSKFRVGAALLCEDGSLHLGCNVENAAYSLGICAERTAAVKAVSGGHIRFKAIAVASDLDTYISPCGSCRQFLVEFNPELVVYLTKSDSSYKKINIKELLPMAFTKEQLFDNKIE